MEEIKKDIELIRFDGVSETIVYMNSFSDLKKAELTWREAGEEISEMLGIEAEVLKLSEIKEQLKGKCHMITIFINDPLQGTILQYGNYGDSWWEIGGTCGYA